MFKCFECGNLFESGEERMVDGFRVCPCCGGSYTETIQCKRCGSHHFDDELYSGLCEECLQEAVTYDSFLGYLRGDGSDRDMLPSFMLYTFFECGQIFDELNISQKFLKFLEVEFRRQMWSEQLQGRSDFLNLCRKYIMDDDGECGRYNYAKWLNGRTG